MKSQLHNRLKEETPCWYRLKTKGPFSNSFVTLVIEVGHSIGIQSAFWIVYRIPLHVTKAIRRRMLSIVEANYHSTSKRVWKLPMTYWEYFKIWFICPPPNSVRNENPPFVTQGTRSDAGQLTHWYHQITCLATVYLFCICTSNMTIHNCNLSSLRNYLNMNTLARTASVLPTIYCTSI